MIQIIKEIKTKMNIIKKDQEEKMIQIKITNFLIQKIIIA
jgi:hypothetical protein